MSLDLQAWARPKREQVEQSLVSLFPDAWPASLGEMCRYPLATGGKRIRPLFCFAAAEAFGRDWREALVPALGVELVHSYSLVHDDLPALDDDSTRRGRPTTHVLYGEAMGLLVGDALLTEAFRLMLQPWTEPALQLRIAGELARAAGYHGMVGGQAADLGQAGPIEDIDTLVRLHRGKTGALIRASVRMGALVGGASEGELEALERYGDAVGLAFQLADDVLDEEQDAGEDGPPSFVKLLGVEGTRQRADQLAQEAEASLAGLDAPALVALARYTVQRKT